MRNRKTTSGNYEYSEDRGQNTMVMLISCAVMLVVIVLLCTVIWKGFHADDSIPGKGTDRPAIGSVSDTLIEGSSISSSKGSDTLADNRLGIIFTKVEDVVTAKELTNLRSEPSTESDDTVVMQLKNGESVRRTGINEELGWSRVEYEGQVLYAATRLLVKELSAEDSEETGESEEASGDAEVVAPEDIVTTASGRILTFTKCNDVITSKVAVNLRTEPSSEQGAATIRYEMKNGETAQRTGYDDASGWSRVEYQGEVLYVVTNLICGVEEN